MRVVETRRCAVVTHDAVVAQHYAVAAAPDRQRVPSIDVDAIEKFGNVAPLQFDLAKRRDVDDADVFANIARFAIRRVVVGFTCARIRMRALPQARVDKARALLFVPSMHRCSACRLDMNAMGMRGKCAERHGRIRRSKRRRADLRR